MTTANGPIDFDPDTGRLRLDPASFEHLVNAAGGKSAPQSLRDLGLFHGSAVDPRLAPGLAAVRAPICQFRVQVSHPTGCSLHQGWLNSGAAAFLLHTTGERYEFLTVGPQFVPVALAHIAALGPRAAVARAPTGAFAESLAALFADDDVLRCAAAEELLRESDCSVGDDEPWRALHLEATWPGPDRALTGRALVLFDSPQGILRLIGNGEGVDVVPLTPRQVWELLIALVPGDAEIDPAVLSSPTAAV